MYQPISLMSPATLVMIPAMILFFVGLSVTWIGSKRKDKSHMFTGAFCLILCGITLFSFAADSFEQSSERRDAMTSNILTKYNEKYGNPIYLTDVEYAGPVYLQDRHKFKLTYIDGSTSKVKFSFDNQTGEPQCSCNLKQPKDLQ